jgi:hypothetical protein
LLRAARDQCRGSHYTASLPWFPLDLTQGTYLSPLFSLLGPAFYNPTFVAAEGGLPGAEASLVAGIEDGQAYFNIHTTQFPGGEIRGGVPEPSTWAMMLLGFAGLGYAAFRRSNRNLAAG